MNTKLPEGYQDLSGGGQEWEPVQNDKLVGTCLRVKEIKKGTGKVKNDTRIMSVETENGVFMVWESAMLRDLFDAVTPGDGVFIQFTGTEENGTDNPTKMFTVGLKRK